MDQSRPEDGKTLLDLTQSDAFIDPKKWNEFYNSVTDLLSGEKIAPQHRGLLPFRVWQIFNDMVRFAKAKKVADCMSPPVFLLTTSGMHANRSTFPTFTTATRKTLRW